MPRRRPITIASTGPCGAVGQRLRRLSEWAVASCFTAAVGCSNEPPGKLAAQLSAAAGPVRQVPCPDLLLVMEPVDAPSALDYIGLFSSLGTSKARSVLGDAGEPCKTAQNKAACLAAIERAIDKAAECEPGTSRCKPFIVTTQRDEVVRHETVESLRNVLGDVNTASEAVLFAQLHGLYAACGPDAPDVPNAGTLVQVTEAGWRLQSRWSGCAPVTGDQIIEIRNDGTSDGFERNLVPGVCTTTGRRPAGLQLAAADPLREPVGEFLARCAQLEAASVPAFRRLARELQRLGSPQLAAAARRSACDELRHTSAMRSLAARYGARPSRPRVAAARRSRTAYEIAHENAVEGCVRETFGALLAWQQSVLAADPRIARTMRSIAADETRHAELSWQVAGWLEPQLMASERKQLARARCQALEQLEREIAADPLPEAARAQLGMPSQTQQHALIVRLAATLDIT